MRLGITDQKTGTDITVRLTAKIKNRRLLLEVRELGVAVIDRADAIPRAVGRVRDLSALTLADHRKKKSPTGQRRA